MFEIYEGLENFIDFEYERERQADDDARADWEEATSRKERKTMNKKEFQLTIKAIRKELGYGAFPKAMLTGAQEVKRTATVNCGFDYYDKMKTEAIVHEVFEHELFREMLKHNDAGAFIETQGVWVKQIRIVWE